MLLAVYKHILRAARPLLVQHVHRRVQRGKEDPARLDERFGIPGRARPEGTLFWFHAASVGEAVSLLALVEKVLRDYPQAHAMMTTGTVTSARLIIPRLPERAFHQYLPLDHPQWVETFLRHWQPDMVFWSESEFWPAMLTAVKAKGIPAVLLNAIVSEQAFRAWRYARGMIASVLSVFQLCLAQDAAEAQRLQGLGAQHVKVSGNLKYAARPLRYDVQAHHALAQAVGARPVVLWASTHPGEEEIACRIHAALEQEAPGVLTILLPRHPERREQIAGVIAAAGLRARLRSAGEMPEADTQIYLADTLGEAGVFYKLSALCVMGGTFVPIGGHNIIEPAHFGCAIVYGPDMSTCRAIAGDFEEAKASLPAGDEKEMQALLLKALKNPEDFARMGERAQKLAEQKSHILDTLTAEIYPLIDRVIAHAESA